MSAITTALYVYIIAEYILVTLIPVVLVNHSNINIVQLYNNNAYNISMTTSRE